MNFLMLIVGSFCVVALVLHFSSIMTVIARDPGNAFRVSIPADAIGVSILRPVCGMENFIEETLRTTFKLEYPRFEILFCAANADDPVVPVVQRLIAEHPHIDARLLIGNTAISGNPKLNNMAKGWYAARNDWILMVDSNVLMPKNHVQQTLSAWRSNTGLVCSPAVGGAPQNLWAELECSFLNTYQARWQCFSDSIGLGFAQGKSMLWWRELLHRAGGIEALAGEIAEDAAATKIIRSLGLKVRLVAVPFTQPLGHRNAAEVWRRQVRWARLRRETFKLLFVPEILAGAVPPLLAGVVFATAAGWPVVGTILPLAIAWYGAEWVLAYAMSWPSSLRSIAAWVLRDVTLPVLWIAGWLGNEFVWRGHTMTVADQGRLA